MCTWSLSMSILNNTEQNAQTLSPEIESVLFDAIHFLALFRPQSNCCPCAIHCKSHLYVCVFFRFVQIFAPIPFTTSFSFSIKIIFNQVLINQIQIQALLSKRRWRSEDGEADDHNASVLIKKSEVNFRLPFNKEMKQTWSTPLWQKVFFPNYMDVKFIFILVLYFFGFKSTFIKPNCFFSYLALPSHTGDCDWWLRWWRGDIGLFSRMIPTPETVTHQAWLVFWASINLSSLLMNFKMSLFAKVSMSTKVGKFKQYSQSSLAFCFKVGF